MRYEDQRVDKVGEHDADTIILDNAGMMPDMPFHNLSHIAAPSSVRDTLLSAYLRNNDADEVEFLEMESGIFVQRSVVGRDVTRVLYANTLHDGMLALSGKRCSYASYARSDVVVSSSQFPIQKCCWNSMEILSKKVSECSMVEIGWRIPYKMARVFNVIFLYEPCESMRPQVVYIDLWHPYRPKSVDEIERVFDALIIKETL